MRPLKHLFLIIVTGMVVAAPMMVLERASAQDVTWAPIAPKVVVITMFAPEAQPWLNADPQALKIPVPGLNKAFPDVACSASGLCVMTTGMGYANAASSVSALIYSRKFDLSKTYFLIAGIAGVSPKEGTLGSVHWARYAIDITLRHEIDPRQIPADWTGSFLGFGTKKPGEKPHLATQTEVYRLNEGLLQKAYTLSRDTALNDDVKAQAYRQHYDAPLAKAAPAVSICDTASSDLYWHGSIMAQQVESWSQLLTDGQAHYCTSQMEDNATLTALSRGADAGLIDFGRIALLRSASNFDREGKDQTAAESLAATSGGFRISIDNLYRVGSSLTQDILQNWDLWSNGVPASMPTH